MSLEFFTCFWILSSAFSLFNLTFFLHLEIEFRSMNRIQATSRFLSTWLFCIVPRLIGIRSPIFQLPMMTSTGCGVVLLLWKKSQAGIKAREHLWTSGLTLPYCGKFSKQNFTAFHKKSRILTRSARGQDPSEYSITELNKMESFANLKILVLWIWDHECCGKTLLPSRIIRSSTCFSHALDPGGGGFCIVFPILSVPRVLEWMSLQSWFKKGDSIGDVRCRMAIVEGMKNVASHVYSWGWKFALDISRPQKTPPLSMDDFRSSSWKKDSTAFRNLLPHNTDMLRWTQMHRKCSTCNSQEILISYREFFLISNSAI